MVTELDLPQLDHTDVQLRGERYRAAMAQISGYQGWLAANPFGYTVLDPESSEFFLRTRQAVFPGLTIAEIFQISDGPLHEEIVKNIINVNGADHSRLRNLVNLPSEEVFTTPHCRRVSGHVGSSKPLSYQGTLVDNIAVRFKDGRIVDAKASRGAEVSRCTATRK